MKTECYNVGEGSIKLEFEVRDLLFNPFESSGRGFSGSVFKDIISVNCVSAPLG